MNELVIVDTSAWICAFSKKGFEEIKNKLRTYLDRNMVAITGIILLELLQGTKSEKEYKSLLRKLEGVHYLPTKEVYWLKASRLSFSLHRKGIKIPSTDILIATIAIENDCSILHKDEHFEVISQHSQLRLV